MVISGILALKFITENPCVTGSIPVGTTENQRVTEMQLSFFIPLHACDSTTEADG